MKLHAPSSKWSAHLGRCKCSCSSTEESPPCRHGLFTYISKLVVQQLSSLYNSLDVSGNPSLSISRETWRSERTTCLICMTFWANEVVLVSQLLGEWRTCMHPRSAGMRRMPDSAIQNSFRYSSLDEHIYNIGTHIYFGVGHSRAHNGNIQCMQTLSLLNLVHVRMYMYGTN